MNEKIELLAPAGTWESFLAAIENGADAVYLGGKDYSARQFASNFDLETIKRATDYAHIRDAKVFLTMNTLISDSEMAGALDFAEKAYLAGIDAIIVQDIGFASVIRKALPNFELHASTQMTIYDLAGVNLVEKMGFKRAVLARELSLEEITKISSNTTMELEVFVHGALCVSYSGQCLMSSLIGGRSANRGKCAQPCRLPYEVAAKNGNIITKDKGYYLSPKDLCSVNILNKVVDTGVKSLKIEGRMKSPEYVSVVVKTYRKYLDRVLNKQMTNISANESKDLKQVFNRGGFSTGYLEAEKGARLMCYEKPKNWGLFLGEVISYARNYKRITLKLEEDISIGDGIEIWNKEEENPGGMISEIKVKNKNVKEAKAGEFVTIGDINGKIFKGNKIFRTSSKKLNSAVAESFGGKCFKKVDIKGKILLQENKPIVLEIWDTWGSKHTIKSDIKPEKAINKPLSRERILEQLNKTGNTPFEFSEIVVEMDEGITANVGEINRIRRKGIEVIEAARRNIYSMRSEIDEGKKEEILLNFPGNSKKRENDLKISVFFYKWLKEYETLNIQANKIYIPFSLILDQNFDNIIDNFKKRECQIFLWVPSVIKGAWERLIDSKKDVLENKVDGILIGNIGTIEKFKNLEKLRMVGEYSLNAFNKYSCNELKEQGLNGVVLSPELTLHQIKELKIEDIEKEIIVYGKVPLMTSDYCPVGSVVDTITGKSQKCTGLCSKSEYLLKDRKGKLFPILCDKMEGRSIIFNPDEIFLGEKLEKIKNVGVDSVRINILDEENKKVEDIVAMHTEFLEKGSSAIKKYNSLIEDIKKDGHTKGHYFRGV